MKWKTFIVSSGTMKRSHIRERTIQLAALKAIDKEMPSELGTLIEISEKGKPNSEVYISSLALLQSVGLIESDKSLATKNKKE